MTRLNRLARRLLRRYLADSVQNRRRIVALKRDLERQIGRQLSGRAINTMICRHLIISPLVGFAVKSNPFAKILTGFVSDNPQHWSQLDSPLINAIRNHNVSYRRFNLRPSPTKDPHLQPIAHRVYLDFVKDRESDLDQLTNRFMEIVDFKSLVVQEVLPDSSVPKLRLNSTATGR